MIAPWASHRIPLKQEQFQCSFGSSNQRKQRKQRCRTRYFETTGSDHFTVVRITNCQTVSTISPALERKRNRELGNLETKQILYSKVKNNNNNNSLSFLHLWKFDIFQIGTRVRDVSISVARSLPSQLYFRFWQRSWLEIFENDVKIPTWWIQINEIRTLT